MFVNHTGVILTPFSVISTGSLLIFQAMARQGDSAVWLCRRTNSLYRSPSHTSLIHPSRRGRENWRPRSAVATGLRSIFLTRGPIGNMYTFSALFRSSDHPQIGHNVPSGSASLNRW